VGTARQSRHEGAPQSDKLQTPGLVALTPRVPTSTISAASRNSASQAADGDGWRALRSADALALSGGDRKDKWEGKGKTQEKIGHSSLAATVSAVKIQILDLRVLVRAALVRACESLRGGRDDAVEQGLG
jgi:hypothetical protein